MNNSFRFDKGEGENEGMSYEEFLKDKDFQDSIRAEFGDKMVESIIKQAQGLAEMETHAKSSAKKLIETAKELGLLDADEKEKKEKEEARLKEVEEKEKEPHARTGCFRLLGGPFDGGYCIPEKNPDDVKYIMAYWPDEIMIDDLEMSEVLCRFMFDTSLPDVKEFKGYKRYFYERITRYDSAADKKNEISNFTLFA